MSWRFRKSFTLVPGLRLNLSQHGLSASIGNAPFTVNVSSQGLTSTVSVPGTGISYRHHVPTPRSESELSAHFAPALSPPSDASPSRPSVVNTAAVEEIHSASTELLTSATLKSVRDLIQSAYRQQQDICGNLDHARSEKAESQARYSSWESGFLFKRLFKKAFGKRQEDYETATARVDELEEQLKLSAISAHIEMEAPQAELFYRLNDEFSSLCDCAAIWDVKTRQTTDKFHERTTADHALTRERVNFSLGYCDLIDWKQRVPHLKNAKGGDMYLYPGFILYRASRDAFSLIEYQDVSGHAVNVSFREEEQVPSDSKVIGQTWVKCNKDGSRDRRFTNNYQIPIVDYGSLVLKSINGLWEEFHFSNVVKLISFLKALNAFTASFKRVAESEQQA